MINKALIVVDVQNDFCPGGTYSVPDGDEVVEPINRLLEFARKNHWFIAFSRDWHPANVPGIQHCIQNTEGAKFHPNLNIQPEDRIISKGMAELSINHYSAFNGEDIKLRDLLYKSNITFVYIVGLAYDYCVKNTAYDSKRYGFKTFIIQDATCGVFKKITSEELKQELESAGINLTNSQSVFEHRARGDEAS